MINIICTIASNEQESHTFGFIIKFLFERERERGKVDLPLHITKWHNITALVLPDLVKKKVKKISIKLMKVYKIILFKANNNNKNKNSTLMNGHGVT